MTPLFLLLISLTLIGALSPLLTFATLFQQKEWRLDRLREHLRRDGWIRQLWGLVRPVVALFACVAIIVWPRATTVIAVMLVCAGLSAAQIVLRKQRYPRPTSKALALLGTALILNIVLMFIGTFQPVLFPIIILLQPIVMLAAWVLWKPVDTVLKNRVMNRAAELRSQMRDVTVIGIAGSVGKTTVKELIAHLLQDLKPVVTPAHVNTEMGVAQWLISQSYKPQATSHKLLIVEMGAYRTGEIALLCRIAQPTIGVMTALGSDHLALFGSEQNIIDANGELIESLPKDGHAFFYGDNAGCKDLAKRAPCPVTVVPDGSYKHSLEGRHNDYNVSLAVAVAKHLGIHEKRITELLQTFKPQTHTFSVKTERGVTILDDTYNISPLSVHAALDWAAGRSERPRVLLTSGLQETGAEENRYLTELGAKAAKSVDRVIFTDKHGADIFAEAFGKPVEVLDDTTERVARGSALLAVGRMPLSKINRLLPTS